MKKHLRNSCFTLILSFLFAQSYSQVVINEYCASNRSIVADQNGNYEDYIELFNTTGSSVDLTGWYLSDDYTDLTKWAFPSGITIAANGFIKVWASGKDQVVGANIHTSFKLTQTKNDAIALSNPFGILVDSVSLKLTQKNNSRGRTPNGSSTWGVFATASPAASNGFSFSEYTAQPTANVAQGFYSAAQVVTLSDADPTATIYYTLNGFAPTTASTVYSGPITISATAVLRAKAYSSNPALLGSFEVVNTYFINEPNYDPHYYVASLASTDFDDLFNSWGTWSIDAYIEFFDKSHVFQCEGMGKVDPHGNDSWAFPQKGIDFEMEDDYGYAHSMSYPMFTERNRNSYDHIILKAGASDNYPFSWGSGGGCHMRDAYAHTLALRQHLDVDVRTYEPIILYINGEYWGLYELREKWDEPDFTNHYYNQKEQDIDVLKFWGGLQVPYGSDTAWNNLYYFMKANSMAVQANYDYVKARLSFTSMIDNMVSNTFFVNCDWIDWNTAWWRGRDPNGDRTKWTYAYWDEDNILGLGQNYSGWPTTNYTADPCDLAPLYQNAGPDMGHLEMLDWLLVNPEFKSLYINRYAELLNTSMSCDTMMNLVDWFVGVLTPEMPGQIARWGGNMTEWQTNLDTLKSFITHRCSLIDSGIVDCYDVTGPFDITVLTEPVGAGTVKVNNFLPGYYPWSGNFFGNVDLNFKAKVNTGNNMVFDHWEVNNNIVNPNINVDSMTMNLQAGDTVVAHFANVLPEFVLTVNVAPVGTGTVTIEGSTPASYPYYASYLSGNQINLKANPGSGYVFDYWELSNHFVNPNSTDAVVYFTLSDIDNIIAHFKKVTGVDEANITSLQVYPNLTQDKFNIAYELTGSTDLSVRLYSLSGMMMKDLTTADESLKLQGKHEVTVSMRDDQLSPGVYFLQFDYPEFRKTFKIVMLPH